MLWLTLFNQMFNLHSIVLMFKVDNYPAIVKYTNNGWNSSQNSVLSFNCWDGVSHWSNFTSARERRFFLCLYICTLVPAYMSLVYVKMNTLNISLPPFISTTTFFPMNMHTILTHLQVIDDPTTTSSHINDTVWN